CLRRVQDRGELTSAEHPEIGEAEGTAFELLLSYGLLTGTDLEVLGRAAQGGHRQVGDITDDWCQQAALGGDRHGDVHGVERPDGVLVQDRIRLGHCAQIMTVTSEYEVLERR